VDILQENLEGPGVDIRQGDPEYPAVDIQQEDLEVSEDIPPQGRVGHVADTQTVQADLIIRDIKMFLSLNIGITEGLLQSSSPFTETSNVPTQNLAYLLLTPET
jgi:hypothetical protein